ncbi:MAG TPA: YigZ family protein [Sphaerochaeta sp.]|nr:YigZ family protein [Sphaerochaeta sp.]HPZ16403.1 YigZ family protein [Sphaerochaeta sp.]
MRILKARAEAEIEVRKSRFIAIALPITDLGEIKALVAEARLQHPGANHVVHAAVVGPDGQQLSYSDDKEPKNTAGRPAVEVLKGSGITDILVLIIRYFGGTLLGTGGLVKAYGESVKEVLKVAKTEELIEKSAFSLTIPYNLYDLTKIALSDVDSAIETEEFTTDVTITGTLPSSNADPLQRAIAHLTNGSVSVVFTTL